MKLIQVDFKNIMELNGKIDFQNNKVIVIYGKNQEGKTNIINAIRYAFLHDIRRGRKGGYDEWALPTKNEMVLTSGTGKIEIIFEHNGKYFKLIRTITKSKSDKPSLLELSSPQGKEIATVDEETFFKEHLKVSLLDILFAPEITGGFKRLYGKEVEDAVGEVFKEVVSIRRLAQKFKERLERIKIGAEAEISKTESDYNNYINSLLQISKELENIPQFESLKKHDIGKTYEKMSKFLDALRDKIRKLEEFELFGRLDELIDSAKKLSQLQDTLLRTGEIKEALISIKKGTQDQRQLTKVINGLQKILTPEDFVKKEIVMHNKNIQNSVVSTLEKLTKSKKLLKESKVRVKKFKIKIENIEELIDEINSVINILKTKETIGKEERATITKVAGKVYAVIPIKTLIRDPSFTRIATQPLPKGSDTERAKHIENLDLKKKELMEIEKMSKDSIGLFTQVKKIDLIKLSQLNEKLGKDIEANEKLVDDWCNKTINLLSAFVGKPQKKRKIDSKTKVDKFHKYVNKKIEEKKSEYLNELNTSISGLGLSLKEFNKSEIEKICLQLKKEKYEIPKYKKVEESLSIKKEEWRIKDDYLSDYMNVPKIVDEMLVIVNSLINNSIDELKLRDAVVVTYNNIINRMKEMKLIKAVAELKGGELRARVKYKDEDITHPARSEQAFFSLAILSALGYYFQMPIFMDEVANNLDSDNLQAFFNLAIELKKSKNLQYIFTVKKTKDFELEGWVRELSDEISIFEVTEKNIQKKQILL